MEIVDLAFWLVIFEVLLCDTEFLRVFDFEDICLLLNRVKNAIVFQNGQYCLYLLSFLFNLVKEGKREDFSDLVLSDEVYDQVDQRVSVEHAHHLANQAFEL